MCPLDLDDRQTAVIHHVVSLPQARFPRVDWNAGLPVRRAGPIAAVEASTGTRAINACAHQLAITCQVRTEPGGANAGVRWSLQQRPFSMVVVEHIHVSRSNESKLSRVETEIRLAVAHTTFSTTHHP